MVQSKSHDAYPINGLENGGSISWNWGKYDANNPKNQ